MTRYRRRGRRISAASHVGEAARTVARGYSRSGRIALVAVMRLRRLDNLFLNGLKVEARRLLHRRKVDERLSCRHDDFLHQDETPELNAHPIEVGYGRTQPRPLEWIKAQVRQNWPIGLHSSAQPSSGLVDEAVLVIAKADCAQCAFGKIEYLSALGRPITGDQVELIIAV